MKNQNSTIQNIISALNDIKNPEMSPSAYDTAWVAKMTSANHDKPMFPQTIQWILQNQKQDGSWGSDTLYYHDRIICTLSCIVALQKYNKKYRFEDQIKKGEIYIYQNLKNLEKDHHPTVGFELLFPALIEEAWNNERCLDYEYTVLAKYISLKNKKLEILESKLYQKPTTLLHSIEFFGKKLDFHKIKKFQARNGSFLNSPAATAYYYMNTRDKDSLQYIEDLLDKFRNFVPVNYPLDIFQRAWVVSDIIENNLEEYFKDEVSNHIDYLAVNWTNEGIAWSKYIDLPDLDDTSVVFRILKSQGYNVNEEVFLSYFDGEKFRCFDGEIHTSVSHLANLSLALSMCHKSYLYKDLNRICKSQINDSRVDGKFFDKWNISDAYPILRVLKLEDGVALINKSRVQTGNSGDRYNSKLKMILEKKNDIEWYKLRDGVWVDKTLYGVKV